MRKKLDKNEVEELAEKIESQFGFRIDTGITYLTKDEKQGLKIFIYTGSKMPEVEAAWVGLHFGTLSGETFTPTLEGARLMKDASRSIVRATRSEIEQIMQGKAITNPGESQGPVLITGDGLACVGIAHGDVVESATPKSRRT